MTVQQSTPISASDGVVVAAVADAGAAMHFRKTAYPDLVREAMIDVLRKPSPSNSSTIRVAPVPSAVGGQRGRRREGCEAAD